MNKKEIFEKIKNLKVYAETKEELENSLLEIEKLIPIGTELLEIITKTDSYSMNIIETNIYKQNGYVIKERKEKIALETIEEDGDSVEFPRSLGSINYFDGEKFLGGLDGIKTNGFDPYKIGRSLFMIDSPEDAKNIEEKLIECISKYNGKIEENKKIGKTVGMFNLLKRNLKSSVYLINGDAYKGYNEDGKRFSEIIQEFYSNYINGLKFDEIKTILISKIKSLKDEFKDKRDENEKNIREQLILVKDKDVKVGEEYYTICNFGNSLDVELVKVSKIVGNNFYTADGWTVFIKGREKNLYKLKGKESLNLIKKYQKEYWTNSIKEEHFYYILRDFKFSSRDIVDSSKMSKIAYDAIRDHFYM